MTRNAASARIVTPSHHFGRPFYTDVNSAMFRFTAGHSVPVFCVTLYRMTRRNNGAIFLPGTGFVKGASVSSSLSLPLNPSPSVDIYHSTGGLAWPSSLFCLDDSKGQWQSGALVATQCVWICIFPLGVLSSDVKRGYVIYVWLKGVSTTESQCLNERISHCVFVCVCRDGRENVL